jgi:type III restriction enzyme
LLRAAVELQSKAVEELAASIKLKKEITFRAPTGSGKTYIMADFMNTMLAENDNIVFLISSLSKGNLARQNYEKFEEYSLNSKFQHLNPFLINTNITGEERLCIPLDYNVYLLPRDLYKAGGKLMQGSMEEFLDAVTQAGIFGGLGKKIILIKDESHIATNNTSAIDIIIFKMVISEGWDIPRACMLYQIRNSRSEQLDEQVMGRVRRNPRLTDLEHVLKN